MKLAMILGKKQGETIKPRLQNIKDNLDIDVFDDVGEFVYNVSKRNTIYDRVLVLSTKIGSQSLKDLHTCWGMYSKETSVIMLSRQGSDEQKAKLFLDTFKTPVACAMLVSSTTVQVIAESVLRPTSELNNEYGLKDFLNVEIDSDEFIAPEPPPTPVQPVTPEPVQQQPQQKGRQQRPAKKKRGGGLFGGIFGSRGHIEEPKQPMQAEQPMSPEQPMSDGDPLGCAQFDSSDEQGAPAETVGQVADWDEQQSFPPVYETVDTFVSPDVDAEDDFSEGISPTQGQQDAWPQQAPAQPMSQPAQSQQSPSHQRPQHRSPLQNHNVPFAQPSSVVDVTFDETLVEDSHQDDDFIPSGATADVDFGEVGTLAGHQESRPTTPRPGHVEQADESFEDLSLASAEAQYRVQKEAPKVITRTVREPVLGSGSALKGVYSGRLKKVIIVTGDRGTGVTSTALNIAQTLSKKVDVLYFDCDTDNHGLLNYIDYSNFKNYEQMHMEGVKVCRSSQVFDRCVIAWDDNLGILTSDFSCDCEDSELQQTSQVVAERSMDFGVVVVDCPVEKLPNITDLILTGQVVICVEGTKRGFMNMLCRLESNPLPVRYKRNMISRGSMFVTKCSPRTDMKRLLAYIKAIYQPSDVDWLSVRPVPFNGKLSDALLNSIMEG